MYKLWATILKDVRVLRRDWFGLIIIFAMPLVLVLIVAGIQAGTSERANKTRLPLLICNKDTGSASLEFVRAVDTMGMFEIRSVPGDQNEEDIRGRLHRKEALMAVVLPPDFSARIAGRTKALAGKALKSFGLEYTSNPAPTRP